MNTAMSVWRGRPRMRVLVRVARRSFTSILAKESQEPQSKHIKRSQEGSENPNRPIDPTAIRTRVRPPQNRIFAEKTGERRKAGNSKSARGHRPKSPWNVVSQAAHATHVLLAPHRVNHRSRGEEEQSFEERM